MFLFDIFVSQVKASCFLTGSISFIFIDFINFVNHTISGMFMKISVVFFVGILAWGYQASRPPPPKTCGSPDGPPVTASRIKLSDGRHLAYTEFGVPRDVAKYKIVFVHGFGSCKHDAVILATLSPVLRFNGPYFLKCS